MRTIVDGKHEKLNATVNFPQYQKLVTGCKEIHRYREWTGMRGRFFLFFFFTSISISAVFLCSHRMTFV